METLRTVVSSMQEAAQAANVPIVTGDTKVVDKGKGDGIFVNTTGIGMVVAPRPVGPELVRPGDVVLVSGELGHMALRFFRCAKASNSKALCRVTPRRFGRQSRHSSKPASKFTVCATSPAAGLSSALNEIASVAHLRITVDEGLIPLSDVVRGACELLGLDPLYVPNEGRFVAFVPQRDADRALAILRSQNSFGWRGTGRNNLRTLFRHCHPPQSYRRPSRTRYVVR